MASCMFNDGNSSVMKVLNGLGLKFNKTFLQDATFKDKRRIVTAEKRAAATTKEARRVKRLKLAALSDQQLLKEGVSYSTGGFS